MIILESANIKKFKKILYTLHLEIVYEFNTSITL